MNFWVLLFGIFSFINLLIFFKTEDLIYASLTLAGVFIILYLLGSGKTKNGRPK